MDSYNDDNVPIDDTAGDVDWVNSEQDLINCEETDAVTDNVSDLTDIPMVDDSEATDDSYPDNPGDTLADFRTDEPDIPGDVYTDTPGDDRLVEPDIPMVDYTDTPDTPGDDRLVEPDVPMVDYTDTPDTPGVDRLVEPDTTRDDFSDRPESISNQSLDLGNNTSPDGAASVEASTDTPASPPSQDQPLAGKPATDSQTDSDPKDGQKPSGSYLRGGMESIATTELGFDRRVESRPEMPEREIWGDTIKEEEGGSGGPERMG